MKHEHSAKAIQERIALGPQHNYLRDWIYGGIDGSVTTFAVVSGVSGARLSTWIILVLGFANLLADGFSMAASNFLGTKDEHDDLLRLEAVENRHIDLEPEGEREEVRQIFRQKGFAGEDLHRIVETRHKRTGTMGSYDANRRIWTTTCCPFTLDRGLEYFQFVSCVWSSSVASLFVQAQACLCPVDHDDRRSLFCDRFS